MKLETESRIKVAFWGGVAVVMLLTAILTASNDLFCIRVIGAPYT